uniref:Uncharacterized protein n=1 Tax=Nelumbo nucifera TaxID=4432 RepID=A0A822ZLG4_NELNU|nr:TPA_asm: hypothetical protein HUJ06_002525 [Nelumbo nucifera]
MVANGITNSYKILVTGTPEPDSNESITEVLEHSGGNTIVGPNWNSCSFGMKFMRFGTMVSSIALRLCSILRKVTA